MNMNQRDEFIFLTMKITLFIYHFWGKCHRLIFLCHFCVNICKLINGFFVNKGIASIGQ